ncbi:MAG: hypothetical protein ACI9SP_004818 [Arenicella sp.]|jgi:hypothetical protein
MAVDIHTHLFNLRYLPLKGIIDARANGVLTKFAAKALVKYLLWRTRDDDVIDGGNSLKSASLNSSAQFSPVLGTLTTQAVLSQEQEDELEAFLIDEAAFADELMTDDDFVKAIFEANDINANEADLFMLGNTQTNVLPMLTSASSYKSAMKADRQSVSNIRRSFKSLLNPLFRKFRELGDFWHWLVLQTESESKIMDTLINTYTSGDEGVQLYIDHMMDMEMHYPGQKKPVYKEPELRMSRMRKLYNSSNGLVLGFYGWCPLRDNALDLVKRAIEEEGFVGVKFYCPNGYRAQDNARFESQDLVNNVVRGGVSASDIDSRNLKLFDYCNSNRVPIFSHSQPGEMESVSGYTGKMSHPKYYSEILQQFEDLIICFGHAGGSEGWLPKVIDDDPWQGTDQQSPDYDSDIELSSYARAIYDACVNNNNVYCGVGAHSEISDSNSIGNFRDRLNILFSESRDNSLQVNFDQRIAYGSDWHMIFKHRQHAFYLKNYQKVFENGSGLEGSRDFFFNKNMLNFLHLPEYLTRAKGIISAAHEENLQKLIIQM